MIRRLEEIEDIMKGLSLLQYYIKFSSNKLGLYDINKACEPFFCELFNILWDTKYKRLEYDEKNHPGIDLGDKKNLVSMQITTDGSKTKLWNTMDKFENHKLYEKYNVLIHFIVGEKHYSLRKTDKIKFNKVKHNIFVTIRSIGDYQYEVHIMDLMDLILLIDEQEGDKISRVCKFINENINAQIEGYQRQLYEITPQRIRPFSASSFINSYGITNPVDQKEILENIQKLAENINELDENAKRFLYRVLIAYKSKTKNFYNRDIVIDPGVVQRQLRIGEGTLQSEIKLLDHAELVDLDALEYDGMLRLRYFDTEVMIYWQMYIIFV
ncbi:SMEK domain-containing protein [Mangrovibacillus sp. Mu-81]|uniref:SMEK domain-containing protein n=1 Tax=Bacillaceae TaxID=186817 RepID=UPI0024957F0C|nr:SMEK domain-containing protein [Rossellomorea aquimaris]